MSKVKILNVVKFDIIYGSRTNLNACKIQLIILFHTVNVKLKGNRRIYRTFARTQFTFLSLPRFSSTVLSLA